jgi:hypothetical protein
MYQEHYDPDQNVCTNQDDFNVAFRKAIDYNNRKNNRKIQAWLYVYGVIWLIFFIWAIVLAMQMPVGVERVEHLVFAMVFSPIYVIAYYLGGGNGK